MQLPANYVERQPYRGPFTPWSPGDIPAVETWKDCQLLMADGTTTPGEWKGTYWYGANKGVGWGRQEPVGWRRLEPQYAR